MEHYIKIFIRAIQLKGFNLVKNNFQSNLQLKDNYCEIQILDIIEMFIIILHFLWNKTYQQLLLQLELNRFTGHLAYIYIYIYK